VFVRADSPFKRVEDVVAEAKKRPLNVATSRIPHPASIGILALGDATKSKFNLIPYGGGNPTQVAVLNGEVDIGVLPIVGIVRLQDKMRILGLFNDKNMLPKETNNAPLINNVFGTKIPDLSSSRSWAIHTEWADKNPAEFKLLADRQEGFRRSRVQERGREGRRAAGGAGVRRSEGVHSVRDVHGGTRQPLQVHPLRQRDEEGLKPGRSPVSRIDRWMNTRAGRLRCPAHARTAQPASFPFRARA
jgi:hypothetical protein